MNAWQQWNLYFQNLHHYIRAQSEKVAELEKTLDSVKQELNALREQRGIRIDKIEYKFDQLKVEKLDGTLNIGITPQSLEDMAVGEEVTKQNGEPVNQTSELQVSVQSELQQYLDKQVPEQFEYIQEKAGFNLDPWHRKMIVEDLSKQMKERMLYYFHNGATADQLGTIKDSVLFRTKADIKQAFDHYISKMTQKDVSE
ncbi:spore germination protein GerPC [Paenibacillus sp. UNC451MF]|uniref:spore germination protein GerPC n=1 Tax=Paenibacillus sp. UNC451MF TaxID=1449063 RepID=UPI00049177D4|nr:spore germination protein GerPC [Paenibacillus sp. UNC451MF]